MPDTDKIASREPGETISGRTASSFATSGGASPVIRIAIAWNFHRLFEIIRPPLDRPVVAGNGISRNARRETEQAEPFAIIGTPQGDIEVAESR